MVHLKSSRGFIMPVMVVGFVLVGLIAIVGTINLFKTPAASGKTASQTIQSNSVQKIALANPPPNQDSGNAPSVQRYNWMPIGSICVQIPFYAGGYPTKESCMKKNLNVPCPLNGNPNQTITPCEVTESTANVKIELNNIPKPRDGYALFYCLKSSLTNCGTSGWQTLGEKNNSKDFPKLCGDGAKGLKTDCEDDGRDWFHAGSTYRIFIAQGKIAAINGMFPGLESKAGQLGNVVETVSFYAKHFYPRVVLPINDAAPKVVTLPGSNITDIQEHNGFDIPVKLTGRNIRGGPQLLFAGNPSAPSDQYNDYYIQVLAHDSDYTYPFPKVDSSCLYVAGSGDAGGGNLTVHLPTSYLDDSGTEITLSEGSYILRITDGAGGLPDHTNPTCNPGDFTYYDIPFSIADGKDITGKPNLGLIAPPIPDPYGKETGVTQPMTTPQPICDKSQLKNGYCTSIPTAIGPIHTEPRAFVGDIFSIVLSIGGIAAFGFFIQAGYRLMTSAGNKEKVGAAREQITAAIMGLLFIILSITILEFIGINILHIPGFN